MGSRRKQRARTSWACEKQSVETCEWRMREYAKRRRGFRRGIRRVGGVIGAHERSKGGAGRENERKKVARKELRYTPRVGAAQLQATNDKVVPVKQLI